MSEKKDCVCVCVCVCVGSPNPPQYGDRVNSSISSYMYAVALHTVHVIHLGTIASENPGYRTKVLLLS